MESSVFGLGEYQVIVDLVRLGGSDRLANG